MIEVGLWWWIAACVLAFLGGGAVVTRLLNVCAGWVLTTGKNAVWRSLHNGLKSKARWGHLAYVRGWRAGKYTEMQRGTKVLRRVANVLKERQGNEDVA